MAGEIPVSFEGSLSRDPELKFASSGKAFVKFSVPVNRRVKQDDGSWGNDSAGTTWFNVTAFGSLAENVAESLTKGATVVVIGRFHQRKWELQDGKSGTSLDVVADSVGVSLRWSGAKPGESGASRSSGGQGDPWAQHTPSGGFESAPPF